MVQLPRKAEHDGKWIRQLQHPEITSQLSAKEMAVQFGQQKWLMSLRAPTPESAVECTRKQHFSKCLSSHFNKPTPSIFQKLSDPKLFTGTNRVRFDKNGTWIRHQCQVLRMHVVV